MWTMDNGKNGNFSNTEFKQYFIIRPIKNITNILLGENDLKFPSNKFVEKKDTKKLFFIFNVCHIQ